VLEFNLAFLRFDNRVTSYQQGSGQTREMVAGRAPVA